MDGMFADVGDRHIGYCMPSRRAGALNKKCTLDVFRVLLLNSGTVMLTHRARGRAFSAWLKQDKTNPRCCYTAAAILSCKQVQL